MHARRTLLVLGMLIVTGTVAAVLLGPDPASASGVEAVAAGGSHTCAVTTAGGVQCWGNNGFGQLGDGTTTNRSTPVDVVGLSSGVAAVAAGFEHACALTTAGAVQCWGRNDFGQLGDGTTTNGSTPVDVLGPTSAVAAVAAGGQHSCALTTAGGVQCWGNNGSGQLGDGTITSSTTPVEVQGLSTDVVSVAAGGALAGAGAHTCALTTGGGVKCWGSNASGALGDGTFTDSSTPVDVEGLTSGVAAIAAGFAHTCAVTTSGGVQCWGSNTFGQVGDGTTEFRTTPVEVSGLSSGIIAISAGFGHTCAVTTSGGVKCWGLNGSRQLGDETTEECESGLPPQPCSTVPVDVRGLASGVTAVAAGTNHSCARTTAGGLKCWGRNAAGQLGDGTTTSSTTPVDVLGIKPMPGDASCDDEVNSIDAALVLQLSAGLVASLACQENADVNGDGMINAVDAALILQYDAGLIGSLPP